MKEKNSSTVENALLEQINSDFSEKEKKKYRLLVQKRDDKRLNSKELLALIDMTNKFEEFNFNRIKALAELASIRKVSLDEIMKDLGIDLSKDLQQ